MMTLHGKGYLYTSAIPPPKRVSPKGKIIIIFFLFMYAHTIIIIIIKTICNVHKVNG